MELWNFLVSRVMPSGIILSIRSDKPISRQILCVQAPHAHTSHQKPAATVQWTNGQIRLISEVMGDSTSKIIFKLQHTANIALIKSSSNWGYGKLFGPAERKRIFSS